MVARFAVAVAYLICTVLSESQYGSGSQCDSDTDCMLNGKCSNSTCVCNQGWTGPSCGLLDMLPATLDNGYRSDGRSSSWGGTVVKDVGSGFYHLVAAKFANECGLFSWRSNSFVVHAVSSSPLGPYSSPFANNTDDVVHPTFGHNPVVFQFEPGLFALYQIGCGNASTQPEDCRNGSSSLSEAPASLFESEGAGCDNPHWTGVSGLSRTAAGPWGPLKALEIHQQADVNASAVWHNGGWLTNPSLVRSPRTGKVYLAYSKDMNRAPGHKHIGVAVGDNWDGPFFDATPYSPIFDLPTFENSEDPNIFIDSNGNFHLLTHTNAQPNWHDVSAHAFSPDGIHWTVSPVAPYTKTIDWEDGSTTTVWKRERPQLLIEDGVLVALVNGVGPNKGALGDYTYTHVQGINASPHSAVLV